MRIKKVRGMDEQGAVSRRLRRLRRRDYYCVIALDHGMSFGPLPGIESLPEMHTLCEDLSAAGIPAVVLNTGAIKQVQPAEQLTLVAQLIGMPLQAKVRLRRVPLWTPLTALSYGADAVSVQIGVGESDLALGVASITQIVDDAHKLGLPVLLMINTASWSSIDDFAATVRAFSELGVDLIKVSPGQYLHGLARTGVTGIGAPLLYPGGEATNEFGDNVKLAAQAGYAGVCVGRNVFQSESKKLNHIVEMLDRAFLEDAVQ